MARISFWYFAAVTSLALLYLLNGFWLDRIYIALAFALCVSSFDLASGFAGLKSFGPIIPFGLSAYGFGVLQNNELGFIFSTASSVLVVALIGLILSEIIFFRREKNYTAWAVAGLVGTVALEQLAKFEWAGMGGSNGMLVARYGGDGGIRSSLGFYIAFCSIIVLGFTAVISAARGRFGVRLLLSQFDPDRLASVGASHSILRRQVLFLQWSVSAAAGACYASVQGIVDPTAFGIDNNLTLLVASVLFGERTILRPAVVIFVYLLLESYVATILPGLQTVLLGLLLIAKVGMLQSERRSTKIRPLSVGSHGISVFRRA